MTLKRILSGVFFLLISSSVLHADAIGTTVTGQLSHNYGGGSFGQNLFSTSSAVIGGAVEFSFVEFSSYQAGLLLLNETADFTGSNLVITVFANPQAFQTGDTLVPQKFTFTDLSFLGATYLGNSPLVSYTFIEHTLTVDQLSLSLPVNLSYNFAIQTAPLSSTVPEPSSIALVTTGLASLLGAARTRIHVQRS